MTNAIPFPDSAPHGPRVADLMIARPDGELLLSRPLNRGSALVVGRHPKNAIVLSDDRISRRHALIFDHDGDWFAADLDSTAGMTGPEGPVRVHRFDPQDPWIQLGPAVLWIDRSGTSIGSKGPSIRIEREAAGGSTPPAMSTEPAPSDLLLARVDLATPQPVVELLDPAGVDRILVGSHPACDLRIEDGRVAELDCIIYREGRHWALANLSAEGEPSGENPRRNPCRTRLSGGFRRRIGSTVLSLLRPASLRAAAVPTAENAGSDVISGLLGAVTGTDSGESPAPSKQRRVA